MDNQAQAHGMAGEVAPSNDTANMVNSVERDLPRESVVAREKAASSLNRGDAASARLDWVDPDMMETLRRRRLRDVAAAREGMQMPEWATSGQLPGTNGDNAQSVDAATEHTPVLAGETLQGEAPKPVSRPVNGPLETPPASVSKRYLQAGRRYFLRDGSREIAFEDRGARMVTVHNRPDIAESMAEMALAKGWTQIRVKGHEDFRRSVWLAAAVRGTGVTGYVPNAMDRANLAELMQARMTNRVEPVASPADPTSKAQSRQGHDSEAATDRGLTGQLVRHGVAPYQHETDGARSYFVTLRGPDGADKTVWGVDLERAMQASGVQPGQTVALSNLGRQPVTVNEPVRDAAGQVIGEQPKAVERNVWQVKRVGPEYMPHDVQSSSPSEAVMIDSRSVDQPGPTVRPGVSPATVDVTGWSPESEFRGELVAHGRAPYQNRIGAQATYFVTLREVDGRQLTVWGADLERAIAADGVRPGDQVHLKNYGRRRVDAEVAVVDGHGAVTGAERRVIERYVWIVTAEPREPRARTPDESTERSDPQRVLHMSVFAEAMRAHGFSDRSVAKVQAKAGIVLDRLNEQGIPVPAPRVFDPAGRVQKPRSRGNRTAPAVTPEIERVLQPDTPAVPSR